MSQALHSRYHVIDTEPTNRSINSFYNETDLAGYYIMRAMPNTVSTAAKGMVTMFLNSDLAELSKVVEAERIRRITQRLTT